MSTQLDGLPARRDDVVFVDDGARSLLVKHGEQGTLALNPTARAIWELCDGRTRPDEMVDAICQVFNVTTEQADADVSRTLDQLTEVGLIQWSSTPRSLDS